MIQLAQYEHDKAAEIKIKTNIVLNEAKTVGAMRHQHATRAMFREDKI